MIRFLELITDAIKEAADYEVAAVEQGVGDIKEFKGWYEQTTGNSEPTFTEYMDWVESQIDDNEDSVDEVELEIQAFRDWFDNEVSQENLTFADYVAWLGKELTGTTNKHEADLQTLRDKLDTIYTELNKEPLIGDDEVEPEEPEFNLFTWTGVDISPKEKQVIKVEEEHDYTDIYHFTTDYNANNKLIQDYRAEIDYWNFYKTKHSNANKEWIADRLKYLEQHLEDSSTVKEFLAIRKEGVVVSKPNPMPLEDPYRPSKRLTPREIKAAKNKAKLEKGI